MLFRFRLNLDQSIRLHESETRETARVELHEKYGKTLNHAAIEFAILGDLKAGDKFTFVGTRAVYVVTSKPSSTELFYKADLTSPGRGTHYPARLGNANWKRAVITKGNA